LDRFAGPSLLSLTKEQNRSVVCPSKKKKKGWGEGGCGLVAVLKRYMADFPGFLESGNRLPAQFLGEVLYEAASAGKVGVVKEVLDYGADIES